MPGARPDPDPLHLTHLEHFALDACGDLTTSEKRLQAFTCYLAFREKICVEFLPLISSRQPYINDHARSHLLRVLRHIEGLLARHFPHAGSSADVPEGRQLTWTDCMILLNALVWHDLGNMRGRQGHATEVRNLFDAVAGHLYEPKLADFIKNVAEAHSGSDAIARCIPNRVATVAYHGESVNQQFLAAVLRFADELDESQERIVTTDYNRLDLVPQSSQRYWFFNHVNESIRLISVASEIGAYAPWVEIHSTLPRSRFGDRLSDGAMGSVTALPEYFRRILKIENERQYCNRYLRAGYHHTGVAGVQVTLDVHEVGTPPTDDGIINFELSDTTRAEDLLRRASLGEIRSSLSDAMGA